MAAGAQVLPVRRLCVGLRLRDLQWLRAPPQQATPGIDIMDKIYVPLAYCVHFVCAMEIVLPDFLFAPEFVEKRAEWACTVFESTSVPVLAGLIAEFENALIPTFLKARLPLSLCSQ